MLEDPVSTSDISQSKMENGEFHDSNEKDSKHLPNVESDAPKEPSRSSSRTKEKHSKKSKKEKKTGTSTTTTVNDPKAQIFEAIAKGDIDQLNRILQKDRHALQIRGVDNATPIHVACFNGQLECLQLMLNERKADMLVRDTRGNTPLHSAVLRDQIEVAMLLVKKYPQLAWEEDNDGNTSIHLASFVNAYNTLKSLINFLQPSQIGTKINQTNRLGKSPLHLAAALPDNKCVEFLLTSFGDIIQVDLANPITGQTALHYAAAAGSVENAKLLLDGQAQPNGADHEGNTPLHCAASSTSEATVSLLIRKGATVVIKNNSGKTPMHIATENARDEICYILTANGADVSIRYQYHPSNKKIIKPTKDEEIMDEVAHLDRYGYLDDGKPAILKKKGKEEEKEEHKRVETERRRASKWSKMIVNWDAYVAKRPKKIKSRLLKGLPDCLRGPTWRLLANCEKKQKEDPTKYQELIVQDSEYSEQIDLDVNRSARNHIIFRDRFGSGQVALFNVLKAYSVYDKEVGYCQGMSDMAAFLLMHVLEEDAFWLLVALLNDKRYYLRGQFLPGFPLLQRTWWIWEKIFDEQLPKLSNHFKQQAISASLYSTKWFLTVFLDAFPFKITIRIWDLFLYFGYDIVYSITTGIMKMFEKRLIGIRFDEILEFFRTFEEMNDLDADEFVSAVMRCYIKPSRIRQYEQMYASEHQK